MKLADWLRAVLDRLSPPKTGLAETLASLNDPSVSLNDPDTWDALTGGTETEAGIRVSHHTALSLAPVWQAVSIISADAASVGLHLYKNAAKQGRILQAADVREYVVSRAANAETSYYTFWRRLFAHSLLWPGGYAYLERQGRDGPVTAAYNLLPDRTWPEYIDGKLYYFSIVEGEEVPLQSYEVFHLQGLSCDNLNGCDLVMHARNAIGLALAAENFSSKFFAHGAHAGGILEIPSSYTQRAADNLEEGFRKRLGKDQWFRTVVLREGAKFHTVTVNAEQSQLHQLREDQVRDVARFFNLPPFKLGVADSQSYNSVEQAQLQYLTGTLWHWLVGRRAEAGMKLLTEKERRSNSHFFADDLNDIAQPDLQTIEAVRSIRRQNGVLSPNEWRREIGMPPRTDPGGDEYGNPNTSSPNAGESKPPAKPKVPAESNGRTIGAL